jgi:hypothetical protein
MGGLPLWYTSTNHSLHHSSSQESLPSQVDEDTGGLSDVDAPAISPMPNPPSARKPPKLGQSLQRRTASARAPANDASAVAQQPFAPPPLQDAQLSPVINEGRRIVPVHQSRITDRPPKVGEKDSSLKIKIELDLEVEVEIYARIKGDVMIGLM